MDKCNIYYLKEDNNKEFNAYGKARKDVSAILSRCGYIGIGKFYNINETNFFLKLMKNICYYFQVRKVVEKKSIVIIQFPLIKGYNRVLPVILKRYRCIVLIHDLDGLRSKDNKREYRDIKYLKLAEGVITHNYRMTEYLKVRGVKTYCFELKCFDYLINSNFISSKNHFDDESLLCYAGNIEKSKFIFDINDLPEKAINVYGSCKSKRFPLGICYQGCCNPEEIVEKISGKFGLVWDGESAKTCSGNYGEYTRYNNPHKLSMYIAANMPVIVWKEAAIAKFVIENKIGYAVSSIEEGIRLIQSIDKDNYLMMYDNVLKLKQKIVVGSMLTRAIDITIRNINEE